LKNIYKKVKLHEVAKINSKQINKDFNSEDIRYIDIASVTKGTIDNIQNLQTSKAPSRAKRLVQKNDILYSTVRPNLEHYVFIKDKVAENTVASTGFAVITPKEELVDPYYLYCLITQPKYTQYLSQVAEQAVSTYPTVSPNVIGDLELSLPPLSEQKRISSILSSFDNKIEQLKKENNILEDIAQSIFKEWFVKYNFPNKEGKPYKNNNGKMINSELGLIPEGWRVGKLGEITSITSGKNLPKKDLATKGKYEVLGANGKIGETNKYLFDKQLIFTGRVGTLGNVFLSNEPAWYSDNTLLIFPKNNFLYYVYRYLQRQRLEKLDRGSTQPLITQTDLKTILLPIPSLSLLNKFEKISTLINNKITQNKNNIDYFQKIKTALLNKLILA